MLWGAAARRGRRRGAGGRVSRHDLAMLAALLGCIASRLHGAGAQGSASPEPEPEPDGMEGCDGAGDTWWIGVVGTVFGCFVSNFGTNIQKVSLDRNSALPEAQRRSSLRQPLWLAGCVCMVAGAIADFAVLPFAPQSLLAPFGTMTLVFNVGMANYLSKERPTLRNVLATSTILLGTVLVVLGGDKCEQHFTSDELVDRFGHDGMLVYIVLVFTFLGVGGYVSRVVWDKRDDAAKVPIPQRKQVAFLMAAVGGTFGGNTILCAKTVGELIKTALSDYYDPTVPTHLSWSTLVFLLVLVANLLAQVNFLNEAIRRYAMLMVIPVYQTFWILSGTCVPPGNTSVCAEARGLELTMSAACCSCAGCPV